MHASLIPLFECCQFHVLIHQFRNPLSHNELSLPLSFLLRCLDLLQVSLHCIRHLNVLNGIQSSLYDLDLPLPDHWCIIDSQLLKPAQSLQLLVL